MKVKTDNEYINEISSSLNTIGETESLETIRQEYVDIATSAQIVIERTGDKDLAEYLTKNLIQSLDTITNYNILRIANSVFEGHTDNETKRYNLILCLSNLVGKDTHNEETLLNDLIYSL